jgi:hypothetical protein
LIRDSNKRNVQSRQAEESANMDLSLERWEGFTPSEREAVARELARHLPSGFTFHSLRLHQLGEQHPTLTSMN